MSLTSIMKLLKDMQCLTLINKQHIKLLYIYIYIYIYNGIKRIQFNNYNYRNIQPFVMRAQLEMSPIGNEPCVRVRVHA